MSRAAAIVLVEDNPADVMIILAALEAHNVEGELFVIVDGEEAIEFIETIEAAQMHCPDLLILDLNLPKKPGRDVLQRMRGCERCRHIPIAILTSSDSKKDRDEAAALGASAYFTKPSRLAEFIKLGSAFKEMLAEGSNQG